MMTRPLETPIARTLLILVLLLTTAAVAVTASATNPAAHSLTSETRCAGCHQQTSLVPGETAAPAITTHLDFLCTDCHDSHGETSNIKLIKEVILTPNSGAREVVFLREVGINSYADGDTVYDGVCESCHTMTRFHRNDHTGNHDHYAGWKCVNCHPHDLGFDPVPVTAVIGEGTPAPMMRVHPSPTRGPVTVTVTAPGDGRGISASIWDINGRVVRRLAAVGSPAGKAVFHWDGTARNGSPARSGVYFCVVDVGGDRLRERFVVTR